MRAQLFVFLVTCIIVLGVITGCFNQSAMKKHYPVQSLTQSYWVAPDVVPCQGVAAMNCLLLNKLNQEQPSQWQLFYDSIEGFNYQPGHFYKIEIIRQEDLEFL